MKIHKPILDQLLSAIEDVFWKNQYADKTVEHYFKNNKKWGSRDRKFFADNLYDIVRHWRKLWFLLGSEPQNDRQMFVKILGVLWQTSEKELPPLPEFDFLKNFKMPKIDSRAIEYSIPDWLDKYGMGELGDRWPANIQALNKKADVILRVNTLKVARERLSEELEKEDILTESIENYPDALRLKERKNVFITESYKNGFFEVQDASSQLIAPFLNPEPGMRVIDACAGAGGKSLHLAALMKNKGKIISMDVVQRKLDALGTRARRAGISIIETRLIDSTKVIKRLECGADKVLLDVPCSGIGAFKRNPDDKWKLTVEKLNELREIQADILDRYSQMVKIKGELVYSTCSIFPSENSEQINRFLNQNPDQWQKLEEDTRFPEITGFDGFYMVRLKRLK